MALDKTPELARILAALVKGMTSAQTLAEIDKRLTYAWKLVQDLGERCDGRGRWEQLADE